MKRILLSFGLLVVISGTMFMYYTRSKNLTVKSDQSLIESAKTQNKPREDFYVSEKIKSTDRENPVKTSAQLEEEKPSKNIAQEQEQHETSNIQDSLKQELTDSEKISALVEVESISCIDQNTCEVTLAEKPENMGEFVGTMADWLLSHPEYGKHFRMSATDKRGRTFLLSQELPNGN
jgi:hypothetical protein